MTFPSNLNYDGNIVNGKAPANPIMENFKFSLDGMYLTAILYVQCFQISLDNDSNEMM